MNIIMVKLPLTEDGDLQTLWEQSCRASHDVLMRSIESKIAPALLDELQSCVPTLMSFIEVTNGKKFGNMPERCDRLAC